jgi:hypothetical protein
MLNINEKKPNKTIPKPINKNIFPNEGMILIKKKKESKTTTIPIIKIRIDLKILFI